ncbi:MAG: Gfo/Idh/MocA family protein [Acidimicrobiia bacterium]
MKKVRLASIGLGAWAKVLARAAQRGDVIELRNCFSRSEETRRSFQDEFGIPRSAATLDELLADPEVEGVIVSTPNDSHREVITAALDAGKAVFTEKPVTHTLEDAFAVKRAVEDSDVVFSVGHSARRLSGHRVMKEWVDTGRLGQVSLAEANFSNPIGLQLSPQAWRWYEDKSPGGSFIQMGVHHADTLQYLLGRVVRVSAHARRLYTEAEIPDAVMAICEFESGGLGYIGCGWASPGVYQLRLQGTEANLMYDVDQTRWSRSDEIDGASTLVSQVPEQSGRTEIQLSPTDMFRAELEEFALAIRGEASIEVGIDDAIRALAVVQAAVASSARNGAAIDIEPMLAGEPVP